MPNQKLCSVAGCSKPHDSHGYCNLHSKRFRRHGDPNIVLHPRASTSDLREYFDYAASYIGDDCILWPYGKANGYGQIEIDGTRFFVHRRICEIVNGPAPTPKSEAAHSCGNGRYGCITSRHLRWATRHENEADKVAQGKAAKGARHGMAKLTEDDVREIRILAKNNTRQAIADKFRVTRRTVQDIAGGRIWKSVE